MKADEREIDIIALLFAIFLPPIGVAIKDGIGFSLFLNCILTLLGYIPGVIHAIFVILRKPKGD